MCETWWDEYWPKCAGRKLPGWEEKNLPPRSPITIAPKEAVKDEDQKGGKEKERKTAEGNDSEKIQETAEA